MSSLHAQRTHRKPLQTLGSDRANEGRSGDERERREGGGESTKSESTTLLGQRGEATTCAGNMMQHGAMRRGMAGAVKRESNSDTSDHVEKCHPQMS